MWRHNSTILTSYGRVCCNLLAACNILCIYTACPSVVIRCLFVILSVELLDVSAPVGLHTLACHFHCFNTLLQFFIIYLILCLSISCFTCCCDYISISFCASFRTICILVKIAYQLCPVCLCTCVSSVPTGWVFVIFDIGDFYESLSKKSKFG